MYWCSSVCECKHFKLLCLNNYNKNTQQHIQFHHNKLLITETYISSQDLSEVSNLFFCLSYDCNTIIKSWNGQKERHAEIQTWLPNFARFKFSDIINHYSVQWSSKTLYKVFIQKVWDSLYLQFVPKAKRSRFCCI